MVALDLTGLRLLGHVRVAGPMWENMVAHTPANRAPGCPALRSASAKQPLWPLWPAISDIGLVFLHRAGLGVGLPQSEPLGLRLLQCLLPRQRRARRRRLCCNALRGRLTLWRPCDTQRGLLGGAKATQSHTLPTASDRRCVGLEAVLPS
eukprot:scaffold45699_cov75-Phaeocystis_antarctica.AAC.2